MLMWQMLHLVGGLAHSNSQNRHKTFPTTTLTLLMWNAACTTAHLRKYTEFPCGSIPGSRAESKWQLKIPGVSWLCRGGESWSFSLLRGSADGKPWCSCSLPSPPCWTCMVISDSSSSSVQGATLQAGCCYLKGVWFTFCIKLATAFLVRPALLLLGLYIHKPLNPHCAWQRDIFHSTQFNPQYTLLLCDETKMRQ